jgi:bifunctional non-homologous end joining protein LigD
MQNRIGQTLASAYGARPRPGAPVSAPLKWSEVTRKLDPGAFTIRNMAKRLDRVGDLWAPMLERQVDVAACLKKLKFD